MENAIFKSRLINQSEDPNLCTIASKQFFYKDRSITRYRNYKAAIHLKLIFSLLIFYLQPSQIFSQIFCDDANVPANRIMQNNLQVGDFSIGFFSNKPNASNICGDEFGYYMVIGYYNDSEESTTLNFEIDIDPQFVNVYSTSSVGISNFNISNIKGVINATVNPFDFYCAKINFAYPQENISPGSMYNLTILHWT